MAPKALADNIVLQELEHSKQTRCANAFVVMRHHTGAALLQGQCGLSAIERWGLALIHAQHDRLIGRIQIQRHHIGELLHKVRIAPQLKTLVRSGLMLWARKTAMTRSLRYPEPQTSCGSSNASRLQAL